MEELIAQLSRIADALEAQNTWSDKWLAIHQQEHSEIRASEAGWIAWNKQIRDEDRGTLRQQQQHMEQEARAFEQAYVMTETFVKGHPEMVPAVMPKQSNA